MKLIRNKSGMTLIELMIVVAILGILSAIAVPNFLIFQSRARQSEVKTNLSAIHVAEVAYFAEKSIYGRFTAIGWAPEGRTRYMYVINDAAGTQLFQATPAIAPATFNAEYTGAGTCADLLDLTTTSFTVGAGGNVDADTPMDLWYVNHHRLLVNCVNDV